MRMQRSFQPQHDLLQAKESGESDGRGRQTILGELAILSGMSRRECWLTSGSSHDIGQQGNPAFRRPSIYSFAFDCPPRAINADIVKAGSISSTRAAASRDSASRPRWAKADARQR